MTERRLIITPVFIALTLLLVSVTISAQSFKPSIKPVAFQPDNKPQTDSPSPKTAAPTAVEDNDNNFGSVNGRVVYDVRPSVESTKSVTNGVGGVKVMLRRVDGGMANFFFERLSDGDGNYEFQAVRPGRYTIEVDRATLPTYLPSRERRIALIDVVLSKSSHFDIYMATQRVITGIVFIDVDGDGKYKEGKDRPVDGACVTANGSLAVSESNGAFLLSDLPPGRISLLVSAPKKNENTHVVLDLGPGPVAKRLFNVPMN